MTPNLMATLTEFTARSIAGSFARFVPPVDEVIAAGGGVCNPVLIQRIGELLSPAKLLRSDELGVPSEAREAMAFAILANEAIHGQRHVPARRHRRSPSRRAGEALLADPLIIIRSTAPMTKTEAAGESD